MLDPVIAAVLLLGIIIFVTFFPAPWFGRRHGTWSRRALPIRFCS